MKESEKLTTINFGLSRIELTTLREFLQTQGEFMPVPKFHEIMLPLLKKYQNKKSYSVRDFLEILSQEFELSEPEKEEKVSSGQSRMLDRIAWAKTYLFKAGLLQQIKRSEYQITARGLDFLQLNWPKMDFQKLLELYPDLSQDKFWNPTSASAKEKITEQTLLKLEVESTPDELLGEIITQKTLQTQSELLAQIKNISPQAFERLVVRLLIAMGYGTEEFSLTTSYTNDGGIDGIVQADELGFEKIYIQAKKYENNVGRPDIQKFVGAMPGTNKGVFITTAKFAPSAAEYLRSRPENIVLIDGEKLTELMYKYNQGVAVKQIIELKSVDNDYFEEL